MDADKSVTATFIQQYTLSVTVSGPGSVDPTAGLFDAGTLLTLTATPGPNARFDAWSGDLVGSVASQPLTMDADKSVTATFVQQFALSVTVNGPGSVTPAAGLYDAGSLLTVTATPGPNARSYSRRGD